MRHAESYGNIQGKIISTTDLPLTERGVRQAERAKEFLKEAIDDIQYAFSSPLLRAKQTAEIVIGGRLNITESADLLEMNLGEMEGCTWAEVREKFSYINIDGKLSEAVLPAGETFADVETRCQKFITEHLANLSKDVNNSLIVTHGITKRVLINCLLGKKKEYVNYLNWADNTSFSIVDLDPKNVGSLIHLNERRHLFEGSDEKAEGGLGAVDFHKWGSFAEKDYITLE